MPLPVRDFLEQDLIDRVRNLSSVLLPEPVSIDARLKKLPGITTVLFDIYGTLIVSASGDVGTASATDYADALEEALKAAKVRATKKETAIRAIDLLTERIHLTHDRLRSEGVEYPEVEIRDIWHYLLESLAEEGLCEEGVDAKTIKKFAIEYECRVNPVWPMPGMEQLLANFQERGVKMGIVSNAQFYTPIILHAFLDRSYIDAGFDESLCAWSYELGEAKPSISLFDSVLSRLQTEHNTSPSSVLYVGNDVLNDIWPASDAGCHTALFAGDARSYRPRDGDERCVGVEPDIVITKLSQIEECIG